MSKYPNRGIVHQLNGTAIANAYGVGTKSAAFQPGRAGRVRFMVRYTANASTTLTTLNVKLQHRYNDDDNTLGLGYLDLPSHLDDVQGAAQPKGPTFELEHAFTVTAGTENLFSFYLNAPQAIIDLRIDCKGNNAGHASDILRIYAVDG